GQNDVAVGVPTAGQSQLDGQILVGHCVNFLPLRAAWDGGTSVREYLAGVRDRVLAAYEHQQYTPGTLVQKLGVPREQGRIPLVDVQFNLERLAEDATFPNLTVSIEPNAKAFVNFDLFLNAIESDQGVRLDIDYSTDLFDEGTIERWVEA